MRTLTYHIHHLKTKRNAKILNEAEKLSNANPRIFCKFSFDTTSNYDTKTNFKYFLWLVNNVKDETLYFSNLKNHIFSNISKVDIKKTKRTHKL